MILLPYPNPELCARVLETPLLAEQCYKILAALRTCSRNVDNEWRGKERWLMSFGLAFSNEHARRGYGRRYHRPIMALGALFPADSSDGLVNHKDHQNRLLAINGQWYGQFGW